MTKKVLEKYNLTEYGPLVESMRIGDLKTFTDTLFCFQNVSIRYEIHHSKRCFLGGSYFVCYAVVRAPPKGVNEHL